MKYSTDPPDLVCGQFDPAWIRFDYTCLCGRSNELTLMPEFTAVARICDGCESDQRLQFENAAIALRCTRSAKVERFSFSNGVRCEPHPDFFHLCKRTAIKVEALMQILRLPQMVLAGGEG